MVPETQLGCNQYINGMVPFLCTNERLMDLIEMEMKMERSTMGSHWTVIICLHAHVIQGIRAASSVGQVCR